MNGPIIFLLLFMCYFKFGTTQRLYTRPRTLGLETFLPPTLSPDPLRLHPGSLLNPRIPSLTDDFSVGFVKPVYEFAEGSTDSNICIKITGTRRNSVTVFITSHSVTADESDYVPLQHYSVLIPVGDIRKCFRLQITDDRSFEEDEVLTLSFDKLTGRQFKLDKNSTATIVIIKNDDRSLNCKSFLRYVLPQLFTHCNNCTNSNWTGWNPLSNTEVPVPKSKCATGKAHLRSHQVLNGGPCANKIETKIACTLTSAERLVRTLNLGRRDNPNEGGSPQVPLPIVPFSVNQATIALNSSGTRSTRSLAGEIRERRQTPPSSRCSPTPVCGSIDTSKRGELSSPCNGSRNCNYSCTERTLAFLLDTSGSIRREDFNTIKTLLSGLIPLICGNIHVAFMTFSHTLQMEFCFHCFNQATLRDAISGISYRGGGTRTGKAIRCLNDNILSSDGFCQMNTDIDCLDVVVVTDGKSNGPLRYPDSCREMNEIKKNWCGRVNVHAIGIGVSDKLEELNCLTNSKDSLFSVDNLDELKILLDDVVQQLSDPSNNYKCLIPACPYEFMQF